MRKVSPHKSRLQQNLSVGHTAVITSAWDVVVRGSADLREYLLNRELETSLDYMKLCLLNQNKTQKHPMRI